MSLADYYIEERSAHPTNPAAWSRHGPEPSADVIDELVLHKATFLPDGKTVLLKDGSKVVKKMSRKNPWKKVD